ncbi:MAG: hypothetical protein ACOYN3_01605 [Acidimicrobiia bacterium]
MFGISNEVFEIPVGDLILPAELGGALTMRRTAVILHGGAADGLPSIRQGIALALATESFAVVDISLVLPFERKRRTPVSERTLQSRAAEAVSFVARNVGAPVAAIGLGPFAGAAIAAAGSSPSDVSAIAVFGQAPRAPRARVRAVRAPALLISEQRDAATIEMFTALAEDLPGVSEVRLLARRGTPERIEELVATWCVRHTPSVVPLAAIERAEVGERVQLVAVAHPEVS